MILDTGICEVYGVGNAAAPGNMPAPALTLKTRSYYALLGYETAPAQPSRRLVPGQALPPFGQEVGEAAARVRIVQDRRITNHDKARLSETGPAVYEIARAWHGTDAANGQPITDLTLTQTGNRGDAENSWGE